ncbi:hypothetical protein ACQJ9X_08065, partial [Helicobacter pylori]
GVMKLNKFDKRMLKWAQDRIMARGSGYICGELYRFPTEAAGLMWYEALYAQYRSGVSITTFSKSARRS